MEPKQSSVAPDNLDDAGSEVSQPL
jgi:hypothetical protein